MRISLKGAKILDFDIENRPLSYLGMDWTTAEITAIACSFGLGEPLYCWLLGRDDPADMLTEFRMKYDEADIVTGHYIIGHDLPIINGAMLEYHMPPLGPKMVWDTKIHLRHMKDISRSQESLGDMMGTTFEKIHMSQADWRAANRLQRIEAAQRRVQNDVRQHQEMRLRLSELGMLNAPTVWSATV
jgi:hypothetical protein